MDHRESREMNRNLKAIVERMDQITELVELYLNINYSDQQKAAATSETDLKPMIQAAKTFDGMKLTKTERVEVIALLEKVKAARG